jgi:hypothetical protein
MQPRPNQPERPLESTLRFRRQSFWQITFPIIGITLGLLVGVVLLYLSAGVPGTSIVADFSLMLVAIPFFLIGLLALAILIGLLYGVAWAIRTLPPYTNTAQRGMEQVYLSVDRITTQAVSLLISGLALLGGLSQTIRKLGIVPDGEHPDTTPPPPGRA